MPEQELWMSEFVFLQFIADYGPVYDSKCVTDLCGRGARLEVKHSINEDFLIDFTMFRWIFLLAFYF